MKAENMKAEKLKMVRFAPKGKDSFYDAVVARVKAYFETNHILLKRRVLLCL